MALKIGYYFSPTIKTPAPFGGGVTISPKFAANVDAMGGQWQACWQEIWVASHGRQSGDWRSQGSADGDFAARM